jgi:hypothetical protein
VPRPLITDDRRRALLARRHLLATADRTDHLPTVADALVALHSSDPATVYLSAVARMGEPTIAAVTAALHDDRSLVRHHGMRRTLWVCTPTVIRTVHASCTADIAVTEWKQLHKWVAATDIAEPEAWVRAARADTLAALHRLGPATTRVLGKAVPALTTKILVGSGKWASMQAAHTRLLLLLGFDGDIVRTVTSGSWVSSEYEWSVTADWLGEPFTGADPAAARNDLVARYLRRFGPATTADVQWWTGWTAAATKAAIAANAAVEVHLEDGRAAWLLPDDVERAAARTTDRPEPWVALLPALDPTAMGWKERAWYLGAHGAFGGPLFDRNGNVGPTVWADGRVVGGWAQRPDGVVAHEFLEPVDAATTRAVAEAAERLRDVIGGARVTPRFPTPLQKSLAAG